MNEYVIFISIYYSSVLLFIFSLLINNLVGNQVLKKQFFS